MNTSHITQATNLAEAETNPDFIETDVLNEQYGYIYKITNVLTGRSYIGQRKHRRGEAWRTYMGSGYRLGDEKKYFGLEFFRKTLVRFTKNNDDANAWEKKLIGELVNSRKPHFNIGRTEGKFLCYDHIAFEQSLVMEMSYESYLGELIRDLRRAAALDEDNLAVQKQISLVTRAIALRDQRKVLHLEIEIGLHDDKKVG